MGEHADGHNWAIEYSGPKLEQNGTSEDAIPTALMITNGPAGGRRLQLAAGEAHVWVADLDAVGPHRLDLLSADERRRAAAIISEDARRRWARGRGLLRSLLGGYLGDDPGGLLLERDPNGKPRLLDHRAGAPSFNLSHSGHLALYAFAPEGSVGIDLQLPRGKIDDLALAARALGPETAETLRALDPAGRRSAFLRAWTRHEAVLKWHGGGIGAPIPAGGPEPWVTDLPLSGEPAAALALDSEPARLLVRSVGEPGLGSAFP